MASSDNICVAVRVSPAKRENDAEEWIVNEGVIYAVRPERRGEVFAFDHVISPGGLNTELYDRIVHPIVTSAMAGYNGTVVIYGPTSSGKTHTMMGSDQDPGVIRRTIAEIFDGIRTVR